MTNNKIKQTPLANPAHMLSLITMLIPLLQTEAKVAFVSRSDALLCSPCFRRSLVLLEYTVRAIECSQRSRQSHRNTRPLGVQLCSQFVMLFVFLGYMLEHYQIANLLIKIYPGARGTGNMWGALSALRLSCCLGEKKGRGKTNYFKTNGTWNWTELMGTGTGKRNISFSDETCGSKPSEDVLLKINIF